METATNISQQPTAAPPPLTSLTTTEQTALPTSVAPPVPAAFDFAPRTLEEAMQLAKLLADSTMVPKDYIGKAGNCFIAMQHGAELGLKPVQSLQSIAVINGKPGIYGDAGKALLLQRGIAIDDWDVDRIEVEQRAECTITVPGRRPVTRSFSVDDAKRARLWGKDGPWTQYPWRQLAWRAFWFAARDAASDVLKGLPPAEELRDMEVDVTREGEEVERSSPQSRTEALREKLKQRKVPALAVVLAAFEGATDGNQLHDAIALARQLSDADKEVASKAYHKALTRLGLRPAPSGSDEAANAPEGP